jgi:hypothetical protein
MSCYGVLCMICMLCHVCVVGLYQYKSKRG